MAPRQGLVILALAMGLAGCGGGGGGKTTADTGTPGSRETSENVSGPVVLSDHDAHRFLAQASFGATPASVERVKSLGYAGWIDEQLGQAQAVSHVATAEAASARWSTGRPRTPEIAQTWWTHAVHDPAQLRQRVAYALSQIFVVSTIDSDLGDNSRTVASYMDMLSERSTGSYRQLLEAVALHPAMGHYLSHRHNLKEDPASGRVPDENFAREVMQLFSIGLVELNDDGSVKLRDGQPVETYTADDVKGLARVFTGWGWHRPVGNNAEWWKCFWSVQECINPLRDIQPMSPYPEAHSASEKRFLGVVIAPQSPPNPRESLRIALDRLASHPNTAPFISRQLIQRLVTSNPSPAYIARVTSVFRSSGGHLPAVIKAILLDAEARQPGASGVDMATHGKLREPVLRLAHLLRALPHTSSTYASTASDATPFYRVTETDSPAYALGQTPLRAPSVFNFYRPGYQPPRTQLSARGLVAPEMQITHETSVLGYANFVASILDQGWGLTYPPTGKPDVQFDLSVFTALDSGDASGAGAMVDEVGKRLLGQALPPTLHSRIVSAVSAMPRDTVTQRRRRAAAAVLLVAVSPPFLVQQ